MQTKSYHASNVSSDEVDPLWFFHDWNGFWSFKKDEMRRSQKKSGIKLGKGSTSKTAEKNPPPFTLWQSLAMEVLSPINWMVWWKMLWLPVFVGWDKIAWEQLSQRLWPSPSMCILYIYHIIYYWNSVPSCNQTQHIWKSPVFPWLFMGKSHRNFQGGFPSFNDTRGYITNSCTLR